LGALALLAACASFDDRFKLMLAPDVRLELDAESVDAALRRLAEGDDRPIALFVHGRGNEPEKSIARDALASIEARHGVRVLMYTWDSFCVTCRPVDRAEAAAPEFAHLLAAVAEARGKGAAADNRLILLTHSMGSIVLEQAAEDGLLDALPEHLFDAIVLASSDSDADGHAEWLRRIVRLAPAVYVTVNPRDWILALSGRNARLGNRVPDAARAEWPVRYLVAESKDFTLHQVFNNANLAGCSRFGALIDSAIRGEMESFDGAPVRRTGDNVFTVGC
jgi:esterase/lipase superfamily enzyme